MRGSPGSGKTTLKHLVHHSLQRYYPSAVIYQLNQWGDVLGTVLRERFAIYVPGFDHEDDDGKEHFLLIDDAEQTYLDRVFWIWVKDHCQSGMYRYRVILFCRYEYNTYGEATISPHIPRECKVELDQELHTDTPRV